MSLKKVIQDYNMWPIVTGRPEDCVATVPSKLTEQDVKRLYHSLESSLSPENLHCDGEISAAAAGAKYRKYHRAIAALVKLGHSSEGYYFD